MSLVTEQKRIKYVVADERAVVPSKAHPSDIGYDITVIDVFKKISNRITLFETGVAVSPPEGYYIEIVPRSSMSKTGYMLANSVGTIDPEYTGTLKVALIKVDTDMEDIKLPFTRCQMVLRKAEYASLERVDSLTETVRADGGFGSSDKVDAKTIPTNDKLNTSLSEILRVKGFSEEEEKQPYEGDDQGPLPEWWLKMSKEEQREYLDKEIDDYQKAK